MLRKGEGQRGKRVRLAHDRDNFVPDWLSAYAFSPYIPLLGVWNELVPRLRLFILYHSHIDAFPLRRSMPDHEDQVEGEEEYVSNLENTIDKIGMGTTLYKPLSTEI